MELQILPHSLGWCVLCHNLFEKVFATKDEALNFAKTIQLYIKDDDSKVEEVLQYELTVPKCIAPSDFVKAIDSFIKDWYCPFGLSAESIKRVHEDKEPENELEYLKIKNKNIVEIKHEEWYRVISTDSFFLPESGLFEYVLEKGIFCDYRINYEYPWYINVESEEGLSLIFLNIIPYDAREDLFMYCLDLKSEE